MGKTYEDFHKMPRLTGLGTKPITQLQQEAQELYKDFTDKEMLEIMKEIDRRQEENAKDYTPVK